MACQGGLEPGRSSQSPAKENVRQVDVIWDSHRDTIVRTLDSGAEGSLEDFNRAIEFFEVTTGIPSNTGTYLGRLPNQSLRETLEQWQEWFDENEHALYWDEERKQVGLRDK